MAICKFLLLAEASVGIDAERTMHRPTRYRRHKTRLAPDTILPVLVRIQRLVRCQLPVRNDGYIQLQMLTNTTLVLKRAHNHGASSCS